MKTNISKMIKIGLIASTLAAGAGYALYSAGQDSLDEENLISRSTESTADDITQAAIVLCSQTALADEAGEENTQEKIDACAADMAMASGQRANNQAVAEKIQQNIAKRLKTEDAVQKRPGMAKP